MLIKKISKRLVFKIILYLPLAFLMIILSSLIFNIIKLNSFDYEKNYYTVQGLLDNTFEYEENITITQKSVIFYNENSAGYGNEGLQTFNYLPNSNLIFVFGASSVVAPKYDYVFAKYLEDFLNEDNNNFKIINFGMDGITSDIIKGRIKSSLKNKIKPKSIILYMGHNDYNNIYHQIRERTSILKRIFFSKIILRYLENINFKYYVFSEEEKLRETNIKPIYIPYFTKIDWVIEPKLKKYLQKLNLIRFDNDYFIKYNKLILDHYSENIYDIIGLAKNHKIPIIIITPISNLEAEPFGVNKNTISLYEQALKEENYIKKITYLQQAKDNEIFSGHIRAKTELNNFLRDLNESGVYILDLEKELIKQEFNFSYDGFYDYIHIKPRIHKQIAEVLYEFMQQKNLI